MLNKNCPVCRHKLDFFELLLLDEHAPRKCGKCGRFLKNSFANSIVSAVIPVLMFAASYYFFDLDFLFSASLLLLIPVLRIALAEPMPYNLNANIKSCSQCGQTNVPFKNSFTKTCENCLLPEPERTAAIPKAVDRETGKFQRR